MYLYIRWAVPIFLPIAAAALTLHAPSPEVSAQPTYKLDVKPHLKPLATLRIEGAKLFRTDLDDDPGFRVQYHIRQLDGKTVATFEARSAPAIDLEIKSVGTFTVVLELFYPAYKGGTGQKGEFKPVSNEVTYKIDGGKIVVFETLPAPKDPATPKK
jgi:hypothetical protein